VGVLWYGYRRFMNSLPAYRRRQIRNRRPLRFAAARRVKTPGGASAFGINRCRPSLRRPLPALG